MSDEHDESTDEVELCSDLAGRATVQRFSQGTVILRNYYYYNDKCDLFTVPKYSIPALVRFLVGPDHEVVSRAEIEALREVAEAADWLYAHSTIETAEEPRLRLEAALGKLGKLGKLRTAEWEVER